jgi:hypothetical protein
MESEDNARKQMVSRFKGVVVIDGRHQCVRLWTQDGQSPTGSRVVQLLYAVVLEWSSDHYCLVIRINSRSIQSGVQSYLVHNT